MSEQPKGTHRISWAQYFLYALWKKGNMPTHTSNVNPTSDHNHLSFWRNNRVGTLIGLTLLVLGSVFSIQTWTMSFSFFFLLVAPSTYQKELYTLPTIAASLAFWLILFNLWVGVEVGILPGLDLFSFASRSFLCFNILLAQSPLGITG